MELERIKELANKDRLTRKERAEVQAACFDAGIIISNTGCPNCYRDALLALYKGTNVPRGTVANCVNGWRVRPKYASGVRLNGRHVSALDFDVAFLESIKAKERILERCE